MTHTEYPAALVAAMVPPRAQKSSYPAPLAALMGERTKHVLGDLFGLSQFGVNLVRLGPQARSALRHAHTVEDEFVYILQGHPTLHNNAGKHALAPGMCAGFKAGTGDAHCLSNDSNEEVLYLEVGTRSDDDSATYPDDDMAVRKVGSQWVFTHKDGSDYD